jgi:hypothetical protein
LESTAWEENRISRADFAGDSFGGGCETLRVALELAET